MKKYILLLVFLIAFSGCKSRKRTKETNKKTIITLNKNAKKGKDSKSSQIVNYSKQFLGTRYKWGGTTKRGMDCSGLVFESFKAHDIYLPRMTRDMSHKGRRIKLRETLKGDLLFFKTKKHKRGAINHVGLVVEIKNNAIYFIHSTTSKGVIITSLNENYWKNAFIEVRRVL